MILRYNGTADKNEKAYKQEGSKAHALTAPEMKVMTKS
jgi:hypothetical protein